MDSEVMETFNSEMESISIKVNLTLISVLKEIKDRYLNGRFRNIICILRNKPCYCLTLLIWLCLVVLTLTTFRSRLDMQLVSLEASKYDNLIYIRKLMVLNFTKKDSEDRTNLSNVNNKSLYVDICLIESSPAVNNKIK